MSGVWRERPIVAARSSVIDLQPELDLARVIRLAINQGVEGRTILVPTGPQAENCAVKDIEEIGPKFDTRSLVQARALDDRNIFVEIGKPS